MYFIYTYYYSIHSKQKQRNFGNDFWHNTGRWQYFTFKLF